MTARPTLASVVIPSQHQQVTTQQEQTETHSSLPPISQAHHSNLEIQNLQQPKTAQNITHNTTGKLAERDQSHPNKLVVTKTKFSR